MKLLQTWKYVLMDTICSFLERIEIDEEVVLLLSYPITFDVDSAPIFLKVMLSHPNTKRAVLLCCVYRSPSDYHFYDNLLVECEKGLLNYGDKLVIMGDLNSNFCHKFHLRKLNSCFHL